MSEIRSYRFEIASLHRTRVVHILLPTDYHTRNERFPVLYMHDGHNLFFPERSYAGETWEIQNAIDHATGLGMLTPIVVGIETDEHRMDEYSPWKSHYPKGLEISTFPEEVFGGEGQMYMDWLVQTLKPWVDQQFLTNPNDTVIAGSSMGGLISLYALIQYADVFRGAGVFSPAFWFAWDEIESFTQERFPLGKHLYMDMGTAETSDNSNPDFANVYLRASRRIAEIVASKPDTKIHYVEEENAIHHESAWRRRFPHFLELMYSMNQH